MNKKIISLVLLCSLAAPLYSMRDPGGNAARRRQADHGLLHRELQNDSDDDSDSDDGGGAVHAARLFHAGDGARARRVGPSLWDQFREFILPYQVIDHEYGLDAERQKLKCQVAPADYQGPVFVDGVGNRFVQNNRQQLILDPHSGQYVVTQNADQKIREIQDRYNAETVRMERGRNVSMKQMRVLLRNWIGKNRLWLVLNYPYFATVLKYGGIGGAIYCAYSALNGSQSDDFVDFDIPEEDE